MKNVKYEILLFLLIIFLSISNNQLTAVELLSPNGGEMLTAGSIHTITWEYTRECEEEMNVLLELSINNGQSWQWIILTANTNWYQWRVPYMSSSQCLIRIRLALICTMIPGPCPAADVDWDWDVDLYDFALLASAWQSSTGDNNWNPRCDITKDNIINYQDLDILNKWWLIGIENPMDTSDETFTIFQL